MAREQRIWGEIYYVLDGTQFFDSDSEKTHMTPLAHALAKELTLPMRNRSEFVQQYSVQLRGALHDIHCFEVSDVIPLIIQFHSALRRVSEAEAGHIMAELAFLPAPKTWIEYGDAGLGDRAGFLLEEAGDRSIYITVASRKAFMEIGYITVENGVLVKKHTSRPGRFIDGTRKAEGQDLYTAPLYVLALINTPRIIGRRQIMPHRGLERDLTREMGVGKFPLHAWTEIKLQVAKPTDIDDGEPHEAHLTGRRALHFCRKHIRIRNGRLEYVSAHWRGDPALGIKRSRYTVTA